MSLGFRVHHLSYVLPTMRVQDSRVLRGVFIVKVVVLRCRCHVSVLVSWLRTLSLKS